MQIGGYVNNLLYQDGLYGGMMVVAGSTTANFKVTTGLAKVGGKLIEQTPAQAAADASGTGTATPVGAAGDYLVYLNAPGAKTAAGVALPRFTINTKEAFNEKDMVQGSKGQLEGRSFVLAKITVDAAGAITAIDNTERLQLKHIPPAAHGKAAGDPTPYWLQADNL